MGHRTRRWMLAMHLILTVVVVAFLFAWDVLGLVERLEFAPAQAVSTIVRLVILLTLAIALAGIVLAALRLRREARRAPVAVLIGHLVALLLLVAFLIGQHHRPPAPAVYTPPAGAAYAHEDVRISLSCGDVLAGSLTLPGGRQPRAPAVVLITGSSPHDRDNAAPQTPLTGYRPFRWIADRLSSHGIAVLRLDDRGIGESVGGDIRQLTTPERAADIEAGIAWLRQRSDIDPARIGLVGLSEGVSIAHMIASRDAGIKALVLLSGIGSSGREVLEYQIRQGVLDEAQLAVLLRDDANTRFLRDFDPLATARQVKQPVLIIHGDRDRYVAPGDAAILGSAISSNGNPDVTVRLLAGYDHTLLRVDRDGRIVSPRIPTEVLALIQEWLGKRL